MQSWLERARVLSGLSVEECARTLYQSEISYMTREHNPGMLTLNEIRALMDLFNDEARRIVWSALCEFRPK